MLNIVVTDNYTPESLVFLKQHLPDCNIIEDTQLTDKSLSLAHALLIRSSTRITKTLLDKAKNLKVIITSTSGFDHIDLIETRNHNIKVMYTPEANINSVAEMTLSLFIQLARSLPEASMLVQKNKWKTELKKGIEISEKTLGIIGLGRIGGKVMQLAKAFGMTVIAYDPYIENFNGAKNVDLATLLQKSDFISLHVPLTKETQQMINAKTLQLLRPDAFLINTCRGGVINDLELAEALKQKKLAGCALDVFQAEPLSSDHPLRGLSNAILSPHIGAFTEQAFKRASQLAAQALVEYFTQNKLTSPLPPNTPWAKHLI